LFVSLAICSPLQNNLLFDEIILLCSPCMGCHFIIAKIGGCHRVGVLLGCCTPQRVYPTIATPTTTTPYHSHQAAYEQDTLVKPLAATAAWLFCFKPPHPRDREPCGRGRLRRWSGYVLDGFIIWQRKKYQ
jgi:hypothetical protein